MEIVKFSEYISEANRKVQIRTLDMVIDETGKLYKNPVIKGNIDMKNQLIIGTDNKSYIAGIERTGKLFSFLPTDNLGNILLNGERIRIEDEFRGDRVFWNNREDYTRILPILPTGWVNVKIDMEVIKKIKRFSKSFSRRNGIEGFKDRLEALSKDVKYRSTRTTKTIQRELSAVMMLHHLNELKTHFDPSSAGFLFESYVAGLIPGSSVKEDNSAIDLVDNRGNTYQIKLVDSASGIAIKKNDGDYLSYYIIAYKYADKVRLFILNGENNRDVNYVENFKTPSENFSDATLKKYNPSNCDFVFDLSLVNIQDKIDNISKGLKGILDTLYNNLSEFQYNVESILTGVDEEGNILEIEEFDDLEQRSINNVSIMKNELSSLVSSIRN